MQERSIEFKDIDALSNSSFCGDSHSHTSGDTVAHCDDHDHRFQVYCIKPVKDCVFKRQA